MGHESSGEASTSQGSAKLFGHERSFTVMCQECCEVAFALHKLLQKGRVGEHQPAGG